MWYETFSQYHLDLFSNAVYDRLARRAVRVCSPCLDSIVSADHDSAAGSWESCKSFIKIKQLEFFSLSRWNIQLCIFSFGDSGPHVRLESKTCYKLCNLDPMDEDDAIWAHVIARFVRVFSWDGVEDTGQIFLEIRPHTRQSL